MFIIPPYIRFALIAVLLLGGIALWVSLGIWYGIFFVITGLILLAGYIFLGTVAPAAQQVQAQDFDGAEKTLNLTLKPEWLYSANRAYYYMMRGNIALNRKQIPEGEAWLRKAEAIDIPTPTEKATLHFQLAQIEYQKKNFTAAKKYLNKAKEANIKIPQIREQIDMMDQALKQSGQMKAAQRMGKQGHEMMGRGGKRRRPKNR
jgi:tetratricopeptide (TPR) repeat protein